MIKREYSDCASINSRLKEIATNELPRYCQNQSQLELYSRSSLGISFGYLVPR
jgi:hypothetical protein